MCRMMEASSHYAVSRLVLGLLFVLNNSEGMLFFWGNQIQFKVSDLFDNI